MSSITQVSESMQMILSTRAKALERQTGFVERASARLTDLSSRKRRS